MMKLLKYTYSRIYTYLRDKNFIESSSDQAKFAVMLIYLPFLFIVMLISKIFGYFFPQDVIFQVWLFLWLLGPLIVLFFSMAFADNYDDLNIKFKREIGFESYYFKKRNGRFIVLYIFIGFCSSLALLL